MSLGPVNLDRVNPDPVNLDREAEMPKNEMPDAAPSESALPEGDVPDGDMPDGGMPDGDAPAVSAATMQVVGHVDAFRPDGVYGWAWCPESPDTRLVLELRRGAEVVAVCMADVFRQDLADNGVGDGGHAFGFLLPPEIGGIPPIELSVVVAETGFPLPRSDLQVSSSLVDGLVERIAALEGVAGALAAQSNNALRIAGAASQGVDGVRHDVARLGSDLAALTAGLGDVREREIAELRRKLEENDTFLMRFDRILADMPDRVAWERSLSRSRWTALLVNVAFSTLSGVLAAFVTYTLMK